MRSSSSSGTAPASPSHARRQQQASAYAVPSSSANQGTSSSISSQQQAELFRSLTWDGSVSLCICLCSEELPAGSDRSIDSLYIQAPRISYLPLLIPEIRRKLLDLVLDENENALLKEDQLWLECEGEPLRWHWPIGLICDFLRANDVGATQPTSSTASSQQRSYFPPPSSARMPRSSGSSSASTSIRVNLHLSNPPTDKLLLSPSIEACRTNFMNQLKEADMVRWGSVRRVTGLRKLDQDSLWESVVNHDFQKFWSVAGKLVPGPSRTTAGPGDKASSPLFSTTSTFDANRIPEANSMRSIPMRIYLPHGGPVVQDVIPPLLPGTQTPQTLQSALSTMLPLLFPPRPTDMSASFMAPQKQHVKRIIVQGIELPLDTELGWCNACLAYPDGWLGVVLGF